VLAKNNEPAEKLIKKSPQAGNAKLKQTSKSVPTGNLNFLLDLIRFCG